MLFRTLRNKAIGLRFLVPTYSPFCLALSPHRRLFTAAKMDNLKDKVAATLTPHGKRHKVTVIGSGNWQESLVMIGGNVKLT